MATRWRLIAAGVGLLLAAGAARAGVYSTLEPKWTLSGDYFRKFQEESLTPLKQLATPEARLPWQKYYELAADGMLASKDTPWQIDPKTLPFEQRLDLAVCLLRVRRPGKGMNEKAILILRDLTTKQKDNFLAMSTLGSAYLVVGDYRSADNYLADAYRFFWSKPFDSLTPEHQDFLRKKLEWTDKDFAWFAKCEKYQRQLVKVRYKEFATKKGPLPFEKAVERLDALFDPDPPPPGYEPLRFVGESGHFEVGKIAAAEKEKIPEDAIEVVQQLLIWTPDDLRLFWLLGELLNAKGRMDDAKIVFTEFLAKFAQIQESKGFPPTIDPKTGLQIIDIGRHKTKFVELHPSVGNRLIKLQEYVAPPPIPIDSGPKDTESQSKTPPSNPNPDGSTGASFLNLDWQTLGVGLGGGALIGFLVSWRLRDFLKRRQARQR